MLEIHLPLRAISAAGSPRACLCGNRSHRERSSQVSFFQLVTKWKGRAVRSLKDKGVAGTTRRAAGLGASFLIDQWKRYSTRNPWNPWYQFLDRRYDRRFAVDTAGIDLLHDISNPTVNAYSPLPLARSTFL